MSPNEAKASLNDQVRSSLISARSIIGGHSEAKGEAATMSSINPESLADLQREAVAIPSATILESLPNEALLIIIKYVEANASTNSDLPPLGERNISSSLLSAQST